jgi:hypothetical protein
MTATERGGRTICLLLAAIDLVLGGGATLLPGAYLSWVHPHLSSAEYPYDWVVRTGILWLMFMIVEMCAALSVAPARWFFCVAILRWIEVPADLAYGALARGASRASQLAIYTAPVLNALFGWYLFAAYRGLTRK